MIDDRFDRPDFVITQIPELQGRTVGSLSREELTGISPWMENTKAHWATSDNDVRFNYAVLKFARQKVGITQQTVADPITLPSQQIFNIPPAPLSSSQNSSQVRDVASETVVSPPALPMSKRIAVEQSEFVSNNVRAAEQQPLEHDSSKREEGISDAPVETQSLKVIRGPDSDQALERLDEANAALDAANSLEQIKEIADIAAAAHLYARRAKRGKEAENKAAAYFCRASAKLGRMIAEGRRTKRIQTGRPKKRVRKVPISESTDSTDEKPMTLAELGLDKRAAAQARKLAKYTPDEFETRLKGKLEKLELSRTSTLEDPKPKEFKPATRQDCVKALFKLIEVLDNSGAESFDTTFLESQKVDFAKYQVVRDKLTTLVVSVDAFAKGQASPQQIMGNGV